MSNDLRSKRMEIPGLTKLDQEFKQKLALDILQSAQNFAQDRQEWLTRWSEYLDQWDNFIEPIRKGVWENSSNVHVPFTMQQCLAHHARLLDVLFGISPSFYIVPTDPADDQKKPKIEVLMQWEIERHANRNQGIQGEVDRWLWDCVTTGRGVLKGVWDEEREKYVDVEPKMEEQLQPDGSVIMVPGNEVVEVIKEEVISAATRFKAIDPLNFYMPAGCTIDDAHELIERIYLSEDDLRRLKENKRFYADVIDRVLEMEGLKQRFGQMERGEALNRDGLEGVDYTDAMTNQKLHHVLEWYGRADVNNDGFSERIVAWVHEGTKELLGWNYLNRISKSSRPPYHVVDFIPRRNWPMGLVELMYPINQELDSMHNIRIDSGVLANVPWGTIKESKTIKADDVQVKPGYFLPVNEHDDIRLLSGQSTMPFFVQEEGILLKHGERLGIPDAGQGQVPNSIGPLSTATGTVSLLGEMNKRLAVYVTRVRASWAQVLKHMYQMLKEHLPVGTVWRVTGEDGKDIFARIESREDFASNVDFHFVANTATLNKEMDKQNSLTWLQTAMNPLLLQLGLTNPATIKNALKDVARALNKQGLSNYVADANLNPIVQSLEEEISFILQGIKPVIAMNDDHQAKIQGLIAHRDTEELINYFQDPLQLQQVVMRFNQAIQLHTQMLEAMQAQAQATNLSGQQDAPTMSNRVAGGPLNTESPEGQGAPIDGGAAAGSPGVTGSREESPS